ncbi:hypothetical protein RhiirC2_768177 [Rhizophagus irregularis]|uniref:Uncharacterized protein n=1 Tax=Rhizophagus irregularis TaxID=588596 RepID=A0A2N1P2P3_9GLOM|nr:hypothetical protein RhiirC2_768177 [Rhizophagus irregularis]
MFHTKYLSGTIQFLNKEKRKGIGRKDKLNISENIDRYFKSSHQQAKHLKQDKQQLKKNNLPGLQENQTVILDDIQSKLDLIQHKNPPDEDSILLKYYKVGKKVYDQMCLLINNNWCYS